jgi:hypothetical protein
VKKENRITEPEIASLVDHYVKVREDDEIALSSIRRCRIGTPVRLF